MRKQFTEFEKFHIRTDLAYYVGEQETFYGYVVHHFHELKVMKGVKNKGKWLAKSTNASYLDLYGEIADALENHNNRPLASYHNDEFEFAVNTIQSKKRTEENGENKREKCKWLVKVLLTYARLQEDYPDFDLIETEEDSNHSKKAATVITRSRIPRYFDAEQEYKIAKTLTDQSMITGPGEWLALLIMYAIGSRNGETAALNFGDVMKMQKETPFYLLTLNKSVIGKTNQLKSGGKTSNMPRKVPCPEIPIQIIMERKKFVEKKLKERGITFPIDKVPIACVGNDYLKRVTVDNITTAAKQFFAELKIDPKQIFQSLDEQEKEFIRFQEKSFTAYLFRRNVFTHYRLLGLTRHQIEFVMGHKIESEEESRKYFNNQDELYKIAEIVNRRVFLNDIQNIDINLNGNKNSKNVLTLLDKEQATYHIPIRKNEKHVFQFSSTEALTEILAKIQGNVKAEVQLYEKAPNVIEHKNTIEGLNYYYRYYLSGAKRGNKDS